MSDEFDVIVIGSGGRVKLSGLPGWVIWLFIHIAFLTGYRNRGGAILTWWLALTRDIRRERIYTTRATGEVQDIYQPGGPEEPDTATSDTAAATPRPPAQPPAPTEPTVHRRSN